VKDVGRKISQIQNREQSILLSNLLTSSWNQWITAGLGEFKIRDLNDEINRLLRLKRVWEYRIRELGGPDYAVSYYKA
jgi:hypothetical protein